MPWRVRARWNFRDRNCDPRSAWTMQPATSAPVAARRATALLERRDREAGLHPRVDGVADDLVAEAVLDRAEVELALAGPVFGDVDQPQRVRLPAAVKSRCTRSSKAGVPGLRSSCRCGPRGLPNTDHQPFARADPPRGPVGHRLALLAGLVGQEPVAELRVVAVGVEQRVRPVRRHPLGVGDRLGQPAVVRLPGDLEHPTRHRDGDPVDGQLADERVHHFRPGRFACDRYAAARRSTSFSCSSSLFRLRSSRSSADSLVRDTGALARPRRHRGPASGAGTTRRSRSPWPPARPSASLLRATRTTSSRNSLGNGFGTVDILPAETPVSTDQMSPIRAADPFSVVRRFISVVRNVGWLAEHCVQGSAAAAEQQRDACGGAGAGTEQPVVMRGP